MNEIYVIMATVDQGGVTVVAYESHADAIEECRLLNVGYKNQKRIDLIRSGTDEEYIERFLEFSEYYYVEEVVLHRGEQ